MGTVVEVAVFLKHVFNWKKFTYKHLIGGIWSLEQHTDYHEGMFTITRRRRIRSQRYALTACLYVKQISKSLRYSNKNTPKEFRYNSHLSRPWNDGAIRFISYDLISDEKIEITPKELCKQKKNKREVCYNNHGAWNW